MSKKDSYQQKLFVQSRHCYLQILIIPTTIINLTVTNCIISATIILFPVGDDTIDDNHNMDQRFDYNNSLDYDRDGRLAPGVAEINDFHDYCSEPHRQPLLNVMQQTQVDEKFQLLHEKGNYSFRIPYVPAIFSLLHFHYFSSSICHSILNYHL